MSAGAGLKVSMYYTMDGIDGDYGYYADSVIEQRTISISLMKK